VEFAILETSGELSVLLKSQNRPATPGDLQVNVPDESLPNILILDGRVRSSELRRAKLSEGWLRSEIEKYGAKDTHDVLFAPGIRGETSTANLKIKPAIGLRFKEGEYEALGRYVRHYDRYNCQRR